MFNSYLPLENRAFMAGYRSNFTFCLTLNRKYLFYKEQPVYTVVFRVTIALTSVPCQTHKHIARVPADSNQCSSKLSRVN